MSDPIIRIEEGADEPTVFGWDSEWTNTDPETGRGGCADWVVADETETERNRGGFKSQDPLHTAIIICLFTDKRRPDSIPSPDGSDDRRGWHGNSYDVDSAAGERELGSLLWTLDRSLIDDQTLRMAVHFSADALQTLVDQGAVDHFEIEAEADRLNGILKLQVNAFDATGDSIFSGAFPLQ